MFKHLFFHFTTVLAVANLSSAAAQTQSSNPDSALQNIVHQLEGTRLPLREAIQHALSNATSVRSAEAAYMSARGIVRRESGTFDPELYFNLNHFNQEQPTSSFFAGAPILKTTQTTTTAGLRMSLPIGTSLDASINTIRSTTNSSFAFLNPQYTATGSLNLRQPLLGGFHVSARKELAKAEEEMDAAKARYDQEVLAIGTEVEGSYWDLYAAERDYAVQKLIRDRAESFLSEAELRAKAGLIGPNQVANAKTFLAEQEILLLDREEQLDRLSDQFASLIGTRPEPGKQRFVTVDKPPGDFPDADVEVLVGNAMEKNLDLQAAKADVEAKRALSKAAFWEALPKVDLTGSLGGTGLRGTPQDVSFGGTLQPRSTRGGTLGEAVGEVVKRDFPLWSVGVEVSIPIGFRNGLGEEDRLEADVIIAEQRQVQLARVLEEQVRATHRELFHGKRRLKAAREGVDAAQEQVRIGLIEFQNGRSTAFELVRLGADYAIAQQRYTQALVRSAKAAASLRQLTSGGYAGTAP